MSEFDNSSVNNNFNSIYDITHKIEEELTYIYEMRMKQFLNSSEKKEKVSVEGNSNESNVLKSEQTVSLFAR